jgi:hypothetical protein
MSYGYHSCVSRHVDDGYNYIVIVYALTIANLRIVQTVLQRRGHKFAIIWGHNFHGVEKLEVFCGQTSY